MRYSYSGKFFAPDVFNAVKAKLQKPFPDTAPTPRRWLNSMDYAAGLLTFAPGMKFRSIHGMPLCIASAPLCTQDPAILFRTAAAGRWEKGAQQPAVSDPQARIGCQSAAGHLMGAAPHGDGEPHPASPGKAGRVAAEGSGLNGAAQAPALGISSAMLSTVLGLTVAITAGILIGGQNAFKFRVADDVPNTPLSAASPASPAAGAPRLALDTTLPRPSAPGSASQVSRAADETARKPAATRRTAAGKAYAVRPHERRAGAAKSRRAAAAPVALAAASKASVPRQARPAPEAAKPVQAPLSSARLGTQYARCEKLKGLLRRERCRWDVCAGNWGKQGCPAYRQDNLPEPNFGQAHQNATRSDG